MLLLEYIQSIYRTINLSGANRPTCGHTRATDEAEDEAFVRAYG
jgi:hypothetical protein